MCLQYSDPTYIVNGDPSADFDGPWVHCLGLSTVVFHVSWASGGSSNGSVKLFGSNNLSAPSPALLPIALGSVATVDTSSAAGRIVATVPASLSTGVGLPAYVRLSFVRTSGSGGAIQVAVIGR